MCKIQLRSDEDLTSWRSLHQGTYNRMLKFLENLKSTVGLPLVNIKYQSSHLSTKSETLLALLMLTLFLPHARAQVLDVLNEPNANNTDLKCLYGAMPGREIDWQRYGGLHSYHSVGHVVHSSNQPELAASAAIVISRNETTTASLLVLPGSDNHTSITIQSTTEKLSKNVTVNPIISSKGNSSGLKIVIDHRLLPNGFVATVYEARTMGHRYHSWNVSGEHFITFNAGAAVLNANKSVLCENGTVACRIAVGMSLLEDEMVTVFIIIDKEANVNHNLSVNTDRSVFQLPPTTAIGEDETNFTSAVTQLNINAITIIVGVVAALLRQYSLI